MNHGSNNPYWELTLSCISLGRCFWAENQSNHQNFKKSLLSCKCGLIFIGMKQKKIFFLKNKIQNGRLKKTEFFKRPPKAEQFFCFIPMKISPHLQDSKDFLKFWWLLWFPAPNNTCLNICNTVYYVLSCGKNISSGDQPQTLWPPTWSLGYHGYFLVNFKNYD